MLKKHGVPIGILEQVEARTALVCEDEPARADVAGVPRDGAAWRLAIMQKLHMRRRDIRRQGHDIHHGVVEIVERILRGTLIDLP